MINAVVGIVIVVVVVTPGVISTILFPSVLCYAILSQSNSIHYDSDVEAKIAYVSKQIANCVRFNNPDTPDEIKNIIANKLIGRGEFNVYIYK